MKQPITKISIGQQVYLRSGGPLMTVKMINSTGQMDGMTTCTWFNGSQWCEGTFHPRTLDEDVTTPTPVKLT